MPAPIFKARRDAKMRARIVSDRTLVYDGPPDLRALTPGERPQHVRAGSGIAWSGEKMVLIQDDADYLALIDGAASQGGVAGMRLKSPGAASKEKAHLNLEAVLSARDWRGEYLLAFGSGASPAHRNIARVRLSGADTELSIFETRKFYQALEELPEFATTTLNIEGVALVPKGVEGRDGARLFQRANGRPRAALDISDGRALNATVDLRLDALGAYLDRCKRDPNATFGVDLGNLRRYDLDEADEVPFTFTDASALPDGRVIYIAAAERSPEAGVKGECFGLALGVIETDGSARYTVVVEKDGAPTRRKAEGLAVRDPKSAYVVVDPESDEHPATLCSVDLTGV